VLLCAWASDGCLERVIVVAPQKGRYPRQVATVGAAHPLPLVVVPNAGRPPPRIAVAPAKNSSQVLPRGTIGTGRAGTPLENGHCSMGAWLCTMANRYERSDVVRPPPCSIWPASCRMDAPENTSWVHVQEVVANRTVFSSFACSYGVMTERASFRPQGNFSNR
jgi:hypothetical protein